MRGKHLPSSVTFPMDALNSLAIGAISGKDRNLSDRRFGGG